MRLPITTSRGVVLRGRYTMARRIAIIRNSESLPQDLNGQGRLWRSGVYADYFIKNGWDVDWIFSSFDHYGKTHRKKGAIRGINQDLNLKVLSTTGYSSNVSFMRLLDHLVFSIKVFAVVLSSKPRYDIVLCSMPTPDSAFFVALACRIRGFKYVVDIRDQWPDVFHQSAARWLEKAIVKYALFPYVILRNCAFRWSALIIAPNISYLKWAKSCSSSSAQIFFTPIPFIEPEPTLITSEYSNFQKDSQFKVVFFGTLGRMFDFEAIKYSLDRLSPSSVSVYFIGDGEQAATIRESFKYHSNVHFLGHVSPDLGFSMLKAADVLWAPYLDIENFRGHVTNKIVEYTCAGRPVVTSMAGLVSDFLGKYEAGFFYESNEELFQSLSNLMKSAGMCQRMGAGARQLYEAEFEYSKVLGELESRLRNV